MFYATWPDRRSLLIDTAQEAIARRIATAEAEGSAPASLVVVPPDVLVWEVFDADDAEDAGDEWVNVEALPHTIEVLDALEDASTADTDAPPAGCGSVAVADDDEEVICELAAHGPEVKHRHGILVWT